MGLLLYLEINDIELKNKIKQFFGKNKLNSSENIRNLIFPIYEFNLLPATYIDRSWLDHIFPDHLLISIQSSTRAVSHLSELILKYYDLKGSFFSEFDSPIFRYALLPSNVLTKLTFYCAIALNHNEIKTVIDRDKKNTLIDCIGYQAYQFALEKASLLLGDFNNNHKSGIMWDNLTAYFYNYGILFFLSCYSNSPKSFYKRLIFKFKKNIIQDNFLPNINIEDSIKCSIIRRIMKHSVEKRWHQLLS